MNAPLGGPGAVGEAGSPPQTMVQAGGRVAESLVTGFTGAPTLLLIVLLNMALFAAGSWFMLTLEKYRHLERVALGELLKACIAPQRPGQ